MTDGSTKLGEIHFNKSNYRDFSNSRLPAFLRAIVSNYWESSYTGNFASWNVSSYWATRMHRNGRNWIMLKWSITLFLFPDQISDNSHKQVIAVGRYVPQKGFDRLIPAWQLVARKHPDWILRIYGDGMREQLQQQIDSLGITASCILEPTVSNIVDKYCESSILPFHHVSKGLEWLL